MADALRILGLTWAGAAALMVGLWLVQRARRDASLVDAGWALGIGVAAVAALVHGTGDPLRRTVVAVLIGLWSLRLSAHLLHDRVIGKPEDGRYQALRAAWGATAQRWFFWFFQLQALLVAVCAAPFVAMAADARPFGSLLDATGVLLWILALVGETLADRQLSLFRADPRHRGRTCRTGLWRCSRHPNYFCEWLHWLAYVLIAAGGPEWWVPTAVAILMLFLLVKVTGIPYTEARALASRGDEYRAYQRTTSAFVPWFPRADPAVEDQALPQAEDSSRPRPRSASLAPETPP